ncbi:5736_t:CDS:2 [Cetraspora pellucida]|uniref:5736_t:CDS:1 n=1 Tax=Cetraspora pellucida TaxID=1433469 RepID=A0A9N9ACG4_9GLOM|nr:5736_t:CDS:2 [Cetraspora pellucida]
MDIEQLFKNTNFDINIIEQSFENTDLDINVETNLDIDINTSDNENFLDILNNNKLSITLSKRQTFLTSNNSATILILVRWKKHEYHVTQVNLEHNHPLDFAAVMFDSGYQKLSYNENMHIQMLYNRGVPIPTIINMLTEQYSRYIYSKDMYNSLNHQSRDYVKDLLQTTELLNHLNSNNEYLTLVNNGNLALISAVRTELLHVKHQLCIWHVEQNIVKNLNNKFKDKFIAFSKDFKAVMLEPMVDQFNTQWDHLIIEYTEAIRTTQQSEATNAYLKCLLGYTAPLPELINAIEMLSYVSLAVSDFVYTLLLEQHNMALTYDIKRQEANLYICSCNYNVQFALPYRHVLAVHIANKEILSLNYIGTHWVIFFSELTMTEKQNDISYNLNNNDDLNNNDVNLNNNNANNANNNLNNNDINSNSKNNNESINESNHIGHVEINKTLALFVEQLNSKYPLLQEDIRDPVIAKTKGRPSGTKYKKTGSEHVTKKNMCVVFVIIQGIILEVVRRR